MEKNLLVYILSDSIGETGEQVLRAAISQFECKNFQIKRFPYISDEEHIMEIINEAKEEKSIIVFTMVVPELRNLIINEAKKNNIETVDIMTPLIDPLKRILHQEPKYESGLIRKLDEKYFKKVEAIEFAVKYDDGKDPRGLKKADIVLVGISRTSKTPLSMYLAHKNIKVANVPLVPEVPVTEEIFNVDPKKIIGLTTNPIKLNEIRQERLKALGLGSEANYASMDRILKELDYAESLMKRLGCPIIDVSNKAVEESANIILNIIRTVNK
ncbi:pyruvate, water dikinase regulatory protein [Anaeromicrobium sediminis]|uniref:Putative pyruvate, phosphate dikinase regulatory protein n=1 Tax=Anaeromicrobium sediminis TaxID=1478221 RepID=A0A267MJ75_9FIRM|nr:pyruvate, water dikinase regulatory protein [Anaeromicrobium sediminis]PAB58915.1 phosphoenolpyruvate synthase regulatory protein [Anaeromicrobium sediminis]